MSLTLEPGTVVRLVFPSGRVRFYVLESTLELSCENGHCLPRHELYCYEVDPLTTKILEGLCKAPADVVDLRTIHRFPIDLEYLVDSDVTFALDAGWTPEIGDDWLTFSRAFLRAIIECLAAVDPPLIHVKEESDLCIHNTDLTDLGLDFMRQHYRDLGDQAIAQDQIPSQKELRERIAQTEQNRTTDDDWQLEDLWGADLS